MGQRLNIGIVGCGTSGLAAAAFLTRDGHQVTLFERFEAPRPLGAGLLLQPTGLAALAALGLDQAAIASGAPVRRLHGRTARGRTVFDILYRDLRPHYFGLGIHRGALFSLLYDEVRRLGVPVTTAVEIVATRPSGDKRLIVDKTGAERGAFDLVIDAGGSRSPLRREAQVKLDRPFPYGAVWGVCEDAGQSFGTDVLQQRYDTAKVMIGALPIGKNPADGRTTLAFFWSLPTNTYEAWRAGGMAAWKERVTGYWPETAPLVAQFNTANDLTFAQYSDVILRRWHGNRLVFIGDAAHCTSPQLGQGANLGLIDALVLSSLLRGGDVPRALAAYTQARRGHLRFYQAASRLLTPFFQSDSRAAALLRDYSFGLMCRLPVVKTQMLHTLAGTKTGLFTHLNPGEWHKDYDLKPPPASQPR